MVKTLFMGGYHKIYSLYSMLKIRLSEYNSSINKFQVLTNLEFSAWPCGCENLDSELIFVLPDTENVNIFNKDSTFGFFVQ